MTNEDVVTIWDSSEKLPLIGGHIIYWRGLPGGKLDTDHHFIADIIEKNAESIRHAYLKYVYELSVMPLHGKLLYKHFQINERLNLWWSSLINEKCNYGKSQQINEAIRILAFDDWFKGRNIKSLRLVSSNPALVECMQVWCCQNNIRLYLEKLPREVISETITLKLNRFTPAIFQGLIWLAKYLVEHWKLRGVGVNNWLNSKNKVTFISYLCNIDPEALSSGSFRNHYWGSLPDFLRSSSIRSNWLHIYVKDFILPTAGDAAKAIENFNSSNSGTEVHVTLATFLNLRVLINTIFSWFRLVYTGTLLLPFVRKSARNISPFLWPLFEADWKESSSGRTAMSNVLHSNLFDSALKVLPKQAAGFYLQENQGWEFGMIQAWKALGNKNLVGVPHTVLRFWDLRYYFDSRIYEDNGSVIMPFPDLIAVNSEMALNSLVNSGFPLKRTVPVEALRFIYLNDIKRRMASVISKNKPGFRLLVLGDYLEKNNKIQMELLSEAYGSLPINTNITVKPHPVCPINRDDYPNLTFNLTSDSLEDLMDDCDVAYVSSFTTAAVDAYCAGVPVITVVDPTTLNMSPLRGCTGAIFVKSASGLTQALGNIYSNGFARTDSKEMFNINPLLPLWRKLFTTLC